jgi:hypothetical protein
MNFTYKRQQTAGEELRNHVRLQRENSSDGFGSRIDRFNENQLTVTPGVGKYQTTNRSLVLESPSISKKGYGVSKAPKLSSFFQSGAPGPCSYSPKMTSIGDIEDNPKPWTAFIESGKGRVPFAAPNKVPGPCAYKINHDPGVPILLKKKKSFYFESRERRSKFLDVNDIPPPLTYQHAIKQLEGPKHDVQWSRSNFIRFSELGKDNEVPGPEKYFKENLEEEYFPRKSLRTSGGYRGRYLGKLQDTPKRPPTTFGADFERAKGRFLGRLDLKAEIPGPGQYFDELHSSFSALEPPSPRRQVTVFFPSSC